MCIRDSPIADNNSALRDEHFFAVNDYDHIYLGGVSLRQLEEDYHCLFYTSTVKKVSASPCADARLCV